MVGVSVGLLFQLPIYAIPLGAAFSGRPALPLAAQAEAEADQEVRRRDARGRRADRPGPPRRARPGLGSASGRRGDAGPIADEFNRVFEEQNLGIPIELSLRNMADRIPVMDVRFFVIAIIIQRATGGDLAEVLDKIGRLIRQRYELLGHVKALTAEGRLSGIVLLALPPGLLAFLSFSNYGYISPLFTTSVGTKMLVVTGVAAIAGRLDDQEDRRDQGVNDRDCNS